MNRPTRTVAAAVVVALAILAGLAGCSSTEDAAPPASTASTSTTEAEQAAGSERLSGSETVMWTADTEATGATADATEATTS